MTTFYSFLKDFFEKKGFLVLEEVDDEGNQTLSTILAVKDRTDGYQDVIQVDSDDGNFVFGIVNQKDRDDYTHCFSIGMLCSKPCDHTAGMNDKVPMLVDLYLESGVSLLQKVVPILRKE
jgi:hypothetical protein